MSKTPQAGSVGEETLALHLRAHKVEFDREVCLIRGRKWRYDFLIKDRAVVIEVNGAIWTQGRHSRGAGLESDYLKINAIVKAGYRPLQYSTQQVVDGTAINEILEVLGK
jgi:very-short-patch-repair endonuclease